MSPLMRFGRRATETDDFDTIDTIDTYVVPTCRYIRSKVESRPNFHFFVPQSEGWNVVALVVVRRTNGVAWRERLRHLGVQQRVI